MTSLSMVLRSGIFGLGLALAFWPRVCSAQTLDPHVIYESRCAGCHAPHAGDFVLDSLTMDDNILVGRKSGHSVEAFLLSGHGRLSPEETAALLDHLLFIQQSGGLFKDKCGICHSRMVDLARTHLIERDGVIYGRYSGRNIPDFLQGHGRLHGDEIPVILSAFQRQLDTR